MDLHKARMTPQGQGQGQGRGRRIVYLITGVGTPSDTGHAQSQDQGQGLELGVRRSKIQDNSTKATGLLMKRFIEQTYPMVGMHA